MARIPRGILLVLLGASSAWADDEAERCLQCHGNKAAVQTEKTRPAPLLAESFSMRWKMYEFASRARPPFTEIPKPHSVLRGTTYYDWPKRAMTEIYHDKCIDIFPQGRDYACQFLSVNAMTHLIRFEGPGSKKPASCCLWNESGFWAPRADVVRNMVFEKTQRLGNRIARWYLLDIPLPGPFGYAFEEKTNTPAAFWFPVISGWVQQNFENYREEAPPEGAFDLPQVCKQATVCES